MLRWTDRYSHRKRVDMSRPRMGPVPGYPTHVSPFCVKVLMGSACSTSRSSAQADFTTDVRACILDELFFAACYYLSLMVDRF